MASYLVTGGAGFIGSHLCDDLIQRNHQVFVLDNLSTGRRENLNVDVKLILGDICDGELVKSIMQKVDGCFHLAGVVSNSLCNKAWLNAHQTNVTGTLNILEAARMTLKGKSPLPIVFSSSAAVYGDNSNLPLRENNATKPISVYGVTKECSEEYMRIANQLYKIPTTLLRLFNVYGKRQYTDGEASVIPIFINNLHNNKPLVINGDGEQTRDFVFVGDVVKFLVRAMEYADEKHHVYNVCTGHPTSINELTKILTNITHHSLNVIKKDKKEDDIYHSVGDPELARSELNLTAATLITNALQECVL